MNHDHILTLMTFFPLAGALVLLIWRKPSDSSIQWWSFFSSIAPLAFVIRILSDFDSNSPIVQFSEKLNWIPSLGIYYFVGVDGLSVTMVLLVTLVSPLAILASFKWIKSQPARGSLKTFHILMLIEQTGLYGAFTALNFFHWFIFWEVSLVPMFFLIKMYGGESRTSAAFQFFVYTFVGSVAMLIGMQFVYLATNTWDFPELALKAKTLMDGGSDSILIHEIKTHAGKLGIPLIQTHAVSIIFFLVLLGFAVKVPLWPLHTWLPSTYTQAPTPASMILTGLMSKMGVYGFLRIVLPIFGASLAEYYNFLLILALITILWAAWAAFAQNDFKTLIAYSSISHLGYCLFGVFSFSSEKLLNAHALALNGVLIQMFAHGLSAAGLFYFAGVLEERFQTRDIRVLGGLRKSLPIMCGLMGITVFASLGLPGLAGFVGEYMIFQGVFPLNPALTMAAVVGIVLTALYLLKLLTRVFFESQDEKWNQVSDLTKGELAIAVFFVGSLFYVGLCPAYLIHLSNASVVQIARLLSGLS